MAVTIKVDWQELQRGISAFQNALGNARNFLNTIQNILERIRNVAWVAIISGAGAKAIVVLTKIISSVMRMIRALEATIEKLQFALQEFQNIENIATERMQGLPTTAFDN